MTVGAALRQMTLASSAVSAAVSRSMFPHRAEPQTVPPFLTYSKISGQRIGRHAGAATLVIERWQISCWHLAYAEAVALADAVRAAVDQQSGMFGSNSLEIQRAVLADDPPEMYDPETKLFHIPVDVMLAVTH